MKKIFINNLKLHDLTESCKFLIESPIEGLEAATVRTSSFNRSGMDGIYISNQFLGERRISLRGSIIAESNSDLITQRQLLVSTLAPSKTNSTLDNKVLYLTTLDDQEYQLNIQVLQIKCPIQNVTTASFLIDILSADNSISGETLHTETIQTKSGGGYKVPYIVPYTLEAGSGGAVIIDQGGDANSYPIIKLYGPLTNPRISNMTTGEWISLTLTIQDGSYVEIDMLNRTIIQGGLTNQIGTKSEDSRFWYLSPGDNKIELNTSVNDELGYAQVIFREKYNGI